MASPSMQRRPSRSCVLPSSTRALEQRERHLVDRPTTRGLASTRGAVLIVADRISPDRVCFACSTVDLSLFTSHLSPLTFLLHRRAGRWRWTMFLLNLIFRLGVTSVIIHVGYIREVIYIYMYVYTTRTHTHTITNQRSDAINVSQIDDTTRIDIRQCKCNTTVYVWYRLGCNLQNGSRLWKNQLRIGSLTSGGAVQTMMLGCLKIC